jgi:hypothetical protein
MLAAEFGRRPPGGRSGQTPRGPPHAEDRSVHLDFSRTQPTPSYGGDVAPVELVVPAPAVPVGAGGVNEVGHRHAGSGADLGRSRTAERAKR